MTERQELLRLIRELKLSTQIAILTKYGENATSLEQFVTQLPPYDLLGWKIAVNDHIRKQVERESSTPTPDDFIEPANWTNVQVVEG